MVVTGASSEQQEHGADANMAWRVRKQRGWVPQPSPVPFHYLYILNPLLTIKMDLLKSNIAIKVTLHQHPFRVILDSVMTTLVLTFTVGNM